MRTHTLVALAIVIVVMTCTSLLAQSPKSGRDTSVKISTEAPANPPEEEAFTAYQRVTKEIKPPKAKSSPDPAYPELPPYTEPNGIVDMLIGIDNKGHVQLVHVLRASNPAFESSAVSTVKKWRFSPAKKDGKPVPVQITVEMRFQK